MSPWNDFSSVKGAMSRRWLAKINGAKKRLKLVLHDWKRCSSLQFLKPSMDVLHNERIINSISYFTPNLINCWQTVFQVRAYFGCAVEPWHCPFNRVEIQPQFEKSQRPLTEAPILFSWTKLRLYIWHAVEVFSFKFN
jgi:hypothetical protein